MGDCQNNANENKIDKNQTDLFHIKQFPYKFTYCWKSIYAVWAKTPNLSDNFVLLPLRASLSLINTFASFLSLGLVDFNAAMISIKLKTSRCALLPPMGVITFRMGSNNSTTFTYFSSRKSKKACNILLPTVGWSTSSPFWEEYVSKSSLAREFPLEPEVVKAIIVWASLKVVTCLVQWRLQILDAVWHVFRPRREEGLSIFRRQRRDEQSTMSNMDFEVVALRNLLDIKLLHNCSLGSFWWFR